MRIARPTATLSKAQREFNRLTERIERLRNELARWQAAEDRARRREAVEVAPLAAKLTAKQREVVLWIDGFLAAPPVAGERLTKKLRAKLTFLLLHLARAVLGDGPDAEVAGGLIDELVLLLQHGQHLDEAGLARAIDMVRHDERPSTVLTNRRSPARTARTCCTASSSTAASRMWTVSARLRITRCSSVAHSAGRSIAAHERTPTSSATAPTQRGKPSSR